MGGKLLQIYNLSQPCRIRRLTPAIPIAVRRYSQPGKQGQKENSPDERADHYQGKEGHDDRPTERAASTADEFRRVAEAKARQGVASQTVEEAADGFQKAAAGKGNIHKLGDERNTQEK